MTIDIPYTFTAGTKAKASEVNADFNAVANFVNQLEVSNTELETLIETLQSSKADLTGNLSNIFRMADAVDNYDGVNLRTLRNLTQNSKDVIKGLVIAKQSDTSVNATAGSCWDSTYTSMITTDTSLIVDQANLSSNTTYYIYITQDKETQDCQLIISLSNSTPTLPAGYEYFRLLGRAITNYTGNIVEVIPVGEDFSTHQFITWNDDITANTTYELDFLPEDGKTYLVWIYNETSKAETVDAPGIPQLILDGYGTVAIPITGSAYGRWVTTSRASKLIGALRLL